MKTLPTALPTTTVTRAACDMAPDPCPCRDHRVEGKTLDGDDFAVRVHRRARGVWVLECGEYRRDWMTFRSLRAAVAHLEEHGS